MVRYSRQPVPGAHALFLRYGDGIVRLRDVGCPAVVRKEAWVLAPPDGWHYYEVLPGGIRRVRQEQERTGPGISEETPFGDARTPQPGTARGEAG